MTEPSVRTRRGILQLGLAAFTVRGLFAEQLVATPSMMEGPYYPDKMPLDTDNDLLIINNAITPAVGDVTHLTGRILSPTGQPLRNALVEIWQVDNNASYLHTKGRNPAAHDGNFQGYGRFLTDSKGQYYFRTIKPVPYNLQGMFRAPHIHVAVNRNGRRICTTQLHIKGHETNSRDPLLKRIQNPRELEAVLVDFKPVPGSKAGELAANFDVVVKEA